MKIKYRQLNIQTDWEWVRNKIPLLRVEDTCGFVAYDAVDNSILACVIFDNFTHKTVQAHQIVVRPIALRHGFFDMCMEFAFLRMNKDRIYGVVAENNHKALRLNRRMGFEEVYRIPEGFLDGVDYIVMELTKEKAGFNIQERAHELHRRASAGEQPIQPVMSKGV